MNSQPSEKAMTSDEKPRAQVEFSCGIMGGHFLNYLSSFFPKLLHGVGVNQFPH